MVWIIEECPREGNHVELGDTVQVYLLLLGGEMLGAQLVVEDDVAAVFLVMFPIDKDDVNAAYRQLREHSRISPNMQVYAATKLTSSDTGLPRITNHMGSKVLKFFGGQLLGEGEELWDLYGIGDVVGQLLEWGYGSGEELHCWLTENGGIEAEKAQEVFDALSKAYEVEAAG